MLFNKDVIIINKTTEVILNVWKSTNIIKAGKSMIKENFVITES